MREVAAQRMAVPRQRKHAADVLGVLDALRVQAVRAGHAGGERANHDEGGMELAGQEQLVEQLHFLGGDLDVEHVLERTAAGCLPGFRTPVPPQRAQGIGRAAARAGFFLLDFPVGDGLEVRSFLVDGSWISMLKTSRSHPSPP